MITPTADKYSYAEGAAKNIASPSHVNSAEDTLTFEDINYQVPNKKRNSGHSKYITLLRGISGSFKAGKLTAVMGPNGAGKTSFFDLLVGRAQSGSLTSGEIKLAGQPRDPSSWTSQCAYLEQDDHVIPQMSVYEFIHFNVSCRSPSLSSEEAEKRISTVIRDLRLDKITDTPISMISGGERKRMMIATEFMLDSNILVLDEPTTGLDSHASLHLFHVLKEHARKTNKIVIMTIHQPGSGLFEMIDELYFLYRGLILYGGPISMLNEWFAQYGMTIPKSLSKTEFLFELFSDFSAVAEIREYEGTVRQMVQEAEDKESRKEFVITNSGTDPTVDYSVNFSHISKIMGRGLKLSFRGLRKCLIQIGSLAISVSLIVVLIYSYNNIVARPMLSDFAIARGKKMDLTALNCLKALNIVAEDSRFASGDVGTLGTFIALKPLSSFFLLYTVVFLMGPSIPFLFESTGYASREVAKGTFSFASYTIAVLAGELIMDTFYLLFFASILGVMYSGFFLTNLACWIQLILFMIFFRPLSTLFSLLLPSGLVGYLFSFVKYIILLRPFFWHTALLPQTNAVFPELQFIMRSILIPFTYPNAAVYTYVPFVSRIHYDVLRVISKVAPGLQNSLQSVLSGGDDLPVKFEPSSSDNKSLVDYFGRELRSFLASSLEFFFASNSGLMKSFFGFAVSPKYFPWLAPLPFIVVMSLIFILMRMKLASNLKLSLTS